MKPGHFDLIKMNNEQRKRVTIYEPGTDAELHVYSEPRADGRPCQVSLWHPTPEELAALNAGNPVQLRIIWPKQIFCRLDVDTSY